MRNGRESGKKGRREGLEEEERESGGKEKRKGLGLRETEKRSRKKGGGTREISVSLWRNNKRKLGVSCCNTAFSPTFKKADVPRYLRDVDREHYMHKIRSSTIL